MLDPQRGSVLAEYVVLLTTVSVGCALATLALGGPLMRLFLVQQAVLLFPLPV